MGFIDISNVSEECICDVNYEVKNMLVRPNPSDEHSIYVELEIEQTCMAFENKEINLIQDLYSPTCNLEYSQRRFLSNTGKIERTNEFTVNEKIQIQDIEEENVVDIEAIPSIANITITESKISYSGDVSINVIYTNEGRLNSRNVKVPFEFSEDNLEQTQNLNIETEIIVQNSKFKVLSRGEAESEVNLKLLNKTTKNVNMSLIDNIQLVENENDTEDYDSLILYIVKPGDTLWNIAKRYHSTVEQIARMNGIEDGNKINMGQKIYISKFRKEVV